MNVIINKETFTRKNTKAVKGLVILMMLFYHLVAQPEKYSFSHSDWYGIPITKALVLCVPIYMFLSGYGLQCSGQIGGVKLCKRLKKLYISFWWVFFPFVGLGLLTGYYDFNLVEFIYSVLGIEYSYNGEWWFLGPYICLVIAYLGIGKINVGWKPYCLLMIAVYIVTRCILKLVSFPFIPMMFVIYLNIFMLGCFFAKYGLFAKIDTLLKYKFKIKRHCWLVLVGIVG